MELKKMYKVNFTNDELEKLNTILNKNKRKKAMSVFQYIIKNTKGEDEFLEISLNRLHERFKRYHKGISLTYFKELAKLLVNTGLLAMKKVGRLKFYGRNILRKITDKKKERNEKDYKIEDTYVKSEKIEEEKEINQADNENKDKEKKVEFTPASEETVIETAYEIMGEAGIKTGSRIYFQVIESLYYILDKKDIHINGMKTYIEKTIEDKVTKQSEFKNRLKDIRNKVHKKIKFNDFKQRERSDEEWNSLEKRLLRWE